MTKDEIIADLRKQVADLTELLHLALDKQPPSLSPGAERQRRYRERHQASQVTSPVTSPSVTGGTIGGAAVLPVLGETLPPEDQGSSQDENKNQGKGSRGNPNVTDVTERDADWLAFKAAYPKSDRNSWPVAERRFKALSKADRGAALDGVRYYHPDPKYTMGAQRWVNERRWETAEDAPVAVAAVPPEPLGITALRAWRQQQDAEAACIEGEVVRR